MASAIFHRQEIKAEVLKCISAVLKIVEEEKKGKNPKAALDSKEYEKSRTRKFSAKWLKLASQGYSMITIRE